MKKQIISEEFKKMQKLAGINEINKNNTGLITFNQIKLACAKKYSDISGGEDNENQEDILSAVDMNELLSILDSLGFNGDEAYEFIFDSIIK